MPIKDIITQYLTIRIIISRDNHYYIYIYLKQFCTIFQTFTPNHCFQIFTDLYNDNHTAFINKNNINQNYTKHHANKIYANSRSNNSDYNI